MCAHTFTSKCYMRMCSFQKESIVITEFGKLSVCVCVFIYMYSYTYMNICTHTHNFIKQKISCRLVYFCLHKPYSVFVFVFVYVYLCVEEFRSAVYVCVCSCVCSSNLLKRYIYVTYVFKSRR